MYIDPARVWKTDAPRTVVVIDGEYRYDELAHDRYRAAERFEAADKLTLSPRDARSDPRVVPRWPCKELVTLSWLVMAEGHDGLTPVRLETRGLPEQDEGMILAAFFADMSLLGSNIEIVTWGGFATDLPQMLLSAIRHDLRLPPNLARLRSPWPRGGSGHTDLMAEVSGGAVRPHLAEVAARLAIPVKLVCRPDRVSELMTSGKWSKVRCVAEGDVMTTAMILMLWRQLGRDGPSSLAAKLRLVGFIAEACAHRSYAGAWIRFGEQAARDAFARESGRMAVIAPQLVG